MAPLPKNNRHAKSHHKNIKACASLVSTDMLQQASRMKELTESILFHMNVFVFRR
jgi:hypothetical protein